MPELRVRPMGPEDARVRIAYFHGSSDAHLVRMGVDRSRLPDPDEWLASWAAECALPDEERTAWGVLWEADGEVVGFSTLDRIVVGVEAFCHLHVLDPGRRATGLGTAFLALSADEYFRRFRLERLYSEPHALNVAPNRALQRVGFRYLFSHETTPGPINLAQVATRWVLERPR